MRAAAVQEPNFHGVYAAVSEKWNDKKLKDTFVKTTIHYLKVGLGLDYCSHPPNKKGCSFYNIRGNFWYP